MVLEISRIDRIPRTYSLASLLSGASSVPADGTGVSVALLAKNAKPTLLTTWTPVTYASGLFSVLPVGPDADATGGFVVPASGDLWGKVTDAPLVQAFFIERITIKGGGAQLLPPTGVPIASVNSKTGAAVVLTAADVGAPTTSDLSTGLAALRATFVAHGSTNPGTSLPSGTEYVWYQTDGAGTLLDILIGVAP